MTLEPRSQGRPPRGDGEVGRARLLEKTREAMRNKPKIDMERREIAQIAGVTPALVSYYFPDKWQLFRAAAKPVVDAYMSDVREVLRTDATPAHKVRALVRIFLVFNFEQGYLLDFYLERRDGGNQEDFVHLNDVHAELIAFFGHLLDKGLVRGSDPAFIQSALWGLCKYVARQPPFDGKGDGVDVRHLLHLRSDMICDLFLNGLAMPSWRPSLDLPDGKSAGPVSPPPGPLA